MTGQLDLLIINSNSSKWNSKIVIILRFLPETQSRIPKSVTFLAGKTPRFTATCSLMLIQHVSIDKFVVTLVTNDRLQSFEVIRDGMSQSHVTWKGFGVTIRFVTKLTRFDDIFLLLIFCFQHWFMLNVMV